MANAILDWASSLIRQIEADTAVRDAVNYEAVARAQTMLMYAKTELEMAQAQHAIVAEMNQAIQQHPELRQQLVVIMGKGINPFAGLPGGGGLPSAAPRQISSSGSNDSTDDWG